MNKLIKTLILPAVVITMLLGFASSAFASNQVLPLSVQFVPNPLFHSSNFLPGDQTTGQVTVTNYSGNTQTILTEAINIFDNDNFGSLLHLKISGSSGVIFDDSLAHFFANTGELPLGTLADRQSAVFTYAISFIDSNDDSYQGKTLGFDVCVGFQGGNSHCGNTTVGDEGGGTGDNGNTGDTGGTGGSGNNGGSGGVIFGVGLGGGGAGAVGLNISNEQAPNISSIGQSGSATITWDTNKLSTSQVIYGPVSGGPYTLNLSAVNFGYPFGTVEDPAKVLHHSVLLTGLVPGQTYVYRVVSHASPPTISFEHQLTVPLLAQGGGSSFIESNPSTNSGGSAVIGTEENPGASSTSTLTLNGASSTEQNDSNPNSNLAGAAAAGIGGWPLLIYILIVVIILLAVYFIWRARSKRE